MLVVVAEKRGVSGKFEQEEKNKMRGLPVGGSEIEVRGSDEVSGCSSASPAGTN